MSIIIGIDHGYYAIKTAHCSFPAGLTSYGEHEPYTRQGLLEFGGCFFVCGSGRQLIQRDKTINDNYYLLTLAAIAKEILQRGLPPECSVRIAAGLPLTSFGRDKPKFKDYLLRSNQPVNYKFEGVEYSITIEEVAIFPQGYAALMTETGLLQDEPSMLLMDLGGWTVDLMRIDNAIPAADTAHSLELGMIRCVDDIREQVRRETGLSLTDAQIENMLAGQPCTVSDTVRDIVNKQGRKYTEHGFVLTQQSYTVEFGWDNQKNDIVLAKTIVSHEQDGDKKCSYSIVNVKDVSDAHKNGQTLVFENARVLPTPEKPGDKVSKIGVGIYKQDREALTYLAGAVYELYTVDDIFSADGTKLLDAGTKLAESSPTNESGFAWFAVDIPIRAETYPDSGNSGRYRIVEVAAPAAYLLDSTPVDVEFTYEGQQIAWQVVDGTNTNLRTTVDISKQDITNGKELPDAKLEIRDADGNLVEGWTSTKTPHTVRGLELEKAYTLTETRAPDGYAEAESIVFKLVQNGTEQVNEVYVKSDDDWVKLDDATVIMQDAPVLDIDKTDIAGNLLPGATLTIRDANDEVVDTWITDYKTHRVPISDQFIKLSDGNKEYIYTLTEDAAPAGFEIALSAAFRHSLTRA